MNYNSWVCEGGAREVMKCICRGRGCREGYRRYSEASSDPVEVLDVLLYAELEELNDQCDQLDHEDAPCKIHDMSATRAWRLWTEGGLTESPGKTLQRDELVTLVEPGLPLRWERRRRLAALRDLEGDNAVDHAGRSAPEDRKDECPEQSHYKWARV